MRIRNADLRANPRFLLNFKVPEPEGLLPAAGGEDDPAAGGRLRLRLQVHRVPRGVRGHQEGITTTCRSVVSEHQLYVGVCNVLNMCIYY